MASNLIVVYNQDPALTKALKECLRQQHTQLRICTSLPEFKDALRASGITLVVVGFFENIGPAEIFGYLNALHQGKNIVAVRAESYTVLRNEQGMGVGPFASWVTDYFSMGLLYTDFITNGDEQERFVATFRKHMR